MYEGNCRSCLQRLRIVISGGRAVDISDGIILNSNLWKPNTVYGFSKMQMIHSHVENIVVPFLWWVPTQFRNAVHCNCNNFHQLSDMFVSKIIHPDTRGKLSVPKSAQGAGAARILFHSSWVVVLVL
jgi:hypothetical protein